MLSPFQKALLGVLAGGALLTALVVGAKVTAASSTTIVSPPSANAPPPGVLAVGEGRIAAPPDAAYLTVGVLVQAPTASEAQSQASARLDRILERAKEFAIPDRDIKSGGFSIQPQFAYDPNKAPRITGYQGNQQILFELHDVKGVARVLDALVQKDTGTSATVRFALDEESPLLLEARAKAIADARKKAEAMATAAGVRLGAPISVSDAVSAAPNPYGPGRFGSAPVPAGFPAGDVELVFRVQVQFAIAGN